MLQEKQYEGMDVSAMQEKLVELSARYGEYHQDEQTEAAQYRSELLALREKIARREAEQYQSKYTQAVAETSSAVKELGSRYSREVKTFEALVPGTACPTCHRKITEASLPEVQGELKKAAAAILTAGREKQAQLMQLQELDRKSAEVFAQFKTEDLQKWSAEAEELEQKAQQAERSYGEQTGNLRAEIQSLNADLTYGRLSQEEYERMLECREEIKQAEAELGALCGNTENCPKDFDQQIKQDEADIQTLKKHLADVAAYVSKRAEMTFSQLKMNRVEIALYDVVKSTGEVRDIFKFTYGGRRYDRLSLSEKVRAGMEVSELMKRLTGRNYPVFVDNMESIDDLANVRPTGQIIMAKCVNGAPLQVRPVNQTESPAQRAA